tara:strand:+ start:751 stop:3471 length:2721 start_codon:yes stop_codon:yes gene_type:complete
MSTFDENIANLRQNNRLRTSQIKTYNADVARFETAKFQRQGELFLLAGELGVNLLKKIEANRKKDQENEDIIAEYERIGKRWLQSKEAAEAEKKFKLSADNQNKQSDYITKVEEASGGDLGDVTSEAQIGTGKLSRLGHVNFLNNKNERFGAWANNQLLNSDEIFFATIDGVPTKIQVNDPNLTYNKKIAVWNHLTRKYLKQHDIQKYSKEFLYLPTDRGGSGFMASIIETRQGALEKLKTEYKIELSEVTITEATRHFANVKTSQSFNDLFTSVKAGFDAKGKPLTYAGAWKRLNDKIFPQMIDAGKLSPHDVLSIGQNTTLNINGKEVILGEHRSLEWGENGKWHRKALEVWSQKGENIKRKNDFKLESAAKEFIKNVKNDTFTSKTDIQRARAVLEQLNKDGSGDFDFTEIDNLLDSDLTKEQADTKALEILKQYNESAEGLKLSELIKSEDVLVQQSPILTKALKDEIQFLKELDASLKGEKKNYAAESKDLNGLSVWEFNNPAAQERWNLIEGYAIRLKRDNPEMRPAQIWKETQAWINENTVEVFTPADQWDDYANTLEGDELTEFNEKRSKLFAKDSEGNFPNVLPEVEFNRSSKVSKEDQLEIDSAKTVKINPETKFTDSSLIIPEEKDIFKNQDIDYNKMLDDIGYIPDSIVDLAAYWGLTTADFIKYRQQANGKKELKPEYARYLNEKEVSTLPSAMKNRLLGKIDDGQYTPEDTSATVARNSLLAGAPIVMTFGENGENFVQAIGDTHKLFADSIDEEGDFTFDEDSGKTLFGLYTGIGMSLDPKVFNDFQPGGAQLFIETINQNISQTDIANMVTSPEFGFNAYSASGNVDFLPVVDMLQESKGQENLNKIIEKLNKYWYTPEEEMTDNASEQDDLSGEITDSTEIIDESLNPK